MRRQAGGVSRAWSDPNNSNTTPRSHWFTGLLGGQIQIALGDPGLAMPQVMAGELKAIGPTSGRSPVVTDAPPLADADVRDVDLEV